MARREQRGKRKKGIGDVISTIIMLIALGVFCFAGYKLVMIYLDYKVGTDEYGKLAEQLAEDEKQTEGFDAAVMADNNVMGDRWGSEAILDDANSGEQYEEMENPIDFASLRDINSDVIGWIDVEAIDVINYPITKAEDNDYYLHRTIYRTDNFAGCIFMDYANHSNFGDRNNILYGHNMKNGSMFGSLRKFREQETWDKSRYIWIYTPDFIYKYEIIGCAEVDKFAKDYQIVFREPRDFEEYLEHLKNQSIIKTDTETSIKDTLITLSTCTGNEATRFIVQAKRIRTFKSIPKAGGYETEASSEAGTQS